MLSAAGCGFIRLKKPLAGRNNLNRLLTLRYCLPLMVGHNQKSFASRLPRGGEQRRRFALPSLYALNSVGNLNQLYDLSVPNKTEVDVAILLLVVVDFGIVILSAPEKLQIDDVLKPPAEFFIRPKHACKIRHERRIGHI